MWILTSDLHYFTHGILAIWKLLHGVYIKYMSNVTVNDNMDMSKFNESVFTPSPSTGPTPGVDMPHFVTGMTLGEPRPELEEGTIEQQIVPSTGTKLVCTTCGRQDWHVLILRRSAGLLEGLCKQADGSGCYPQATRRNCSYTYPNQIDCPQVAEYCIALGKEKRSPRQVCRDHVGEMLRQGPLYQVWPLED